LGGSSQGQWVRLMLRPHLTHLTARVNQLLPLIPSPFLARPLSDHVKPKKS
jgi:hypothetical protein